MVGLSGDPATIWENWSLSCCVYPVISEKSRPSSTNIPWIGNRGRLRWFGQGLVDPFGRGHNGGVSLIVLS